MTLSPIAATWLLQSFVLMMMAGSVAGLAVGITLIVRPQRLRRVSDTLNRWVSTRHMDQSLERTIKLDPWFYRYRRASGLLTLLGALYILYFFTVSLDRVAAIAGLSKHFQLPPSLIAALLDALVLSALLGALFAALVSLFLFLRPSVLREFEQGANRWLSLRQALKPMEKSRAGVDEYVFQHARRVGIFLVIGSLYALVLLTFWLSRYH